MYPELLRALLLNLHLQPRPYLTSDEIGRFDRSHVKLLAESGILAKSFPADTITCDECKERCTLDVETMTGPDGKITRACIYCDGRDDMPHRISVDLERLLFWRVSESALASKLAGLMGLNSTPAEIARGRLWRLGAIKSAVGRIDVFFVVAVSARDFSRVWTKALAATEECTSAALLMPSEFANRRNLGSNMRSFSLTRLLTIEEAELRLDTDEILNAFGLPCPQTCDAEEFRFSQGFASVTLRGRTHKLLRPQAEVIKALYEAHMNHTPWLHKEYLLVDVIESDQERLRDIFKSNKDAWKDLIVSDNKGNYRLNIH